MYDPHQVLQALDANKVGVIAFCGLAMIFNYIWFVQAVRQGFKDQVYPIPMFSTLFWLCGDGTGVLRHDMYFVQYHHWYLELFWYALIFTVTFEIIFIVMTLKFGKKELTPRWRSQDFYLLFAGGAVIFGLSWAYILTALPDDLNIIYFNLANMAGPIAMAMLILRRGGSTAGTSTAIWVNYTLMISCWYFAQYTYFGPEFRTPLMLTFYLVNIGSAAGLAVYLWRQRVPKTAAPDHKQASMA